MTFVSLECEEGSHHWLERLVTNSSLDYISYESDPEISL